MPAQNDEASSGDEQLRHRQLAIEQAKESFQRAMTAIHGGRRDWANEELDRVIADCAEVIRVDPKHAVAYQLRARAYEHKGEDDKAEQDMAKARQLNAGGG